MLSKLNKVLKLTVDVNEGWLGKKFQYSNGWELWRNDNHPLILFKNNKIHGKAEPGFSTISVNMAAINGNHVREQYIEQHELAHLLLIKAGDWTQKDTLPYVVQEIFPDAYAAIKTGVFFKRGRLLNALVLITIKLLGHKTPICYARGS
jgi:hypothetical protein